MMGVGAKRAIGLYRSCAPRQRHAGLEFVCIFGHDAIATPSAELEYVSDHDGGFKQPLGRCKLLNRWAFEYFDQTAK